MRTTERPWYFWPLIAFIAGLLIGLVVLGWGVWPVTWTNATVQDLRPDLRMQYVAMVAESYGQTRDIATARQRLTGWSQEDLTELLTEAQTVLVARDPQAATNVQQLAVALGAAETAPAAGAGPEQPAPVATTAAGGGAEQQPSRLRQICTAGIFLIVALVALAALIYLYRRWQGARDVDRVPTAFEGYAPLPGQTPAEVAAEQEKARPLGTQGYEWEEVPLTTATVSPSRPDETLDRDLGEEPDLAVDDDGAGPQGADTRPTAAPRPIGPTPSVPARGEPEMRTPQPSPATPPLKPTSGLKMLVENTAIYQMGEPDYDEAFDINDPMDGYMGQCGLQLIEPFGRDRDQAVALQVWLWDSSDPDTQTLVLMSEGAYRDTALRSQYSGEHPAISVRPGTEFELTSHDLLLRGRVEKVSYAEAEPVRGVFADLQVKLTVHRRD